MGKSYRVFVKGTSMMLTADWPVKNTNFNNIYPSIPCSTETTDPLEMTNLDEVVQVAKFAHVRDSLLFGHILEDLSHVLRRLWKKDDRRAVSCEVIRETGMGTHRTLRSAWNSKIKVIRTISIIGVLQPQQAENCFLGRNQMLYGNIRN